MNNVEQIVVRKECSLKTALELLDQSGKTILLLVDMEGALIRTVTDGDIRRLLLAEKSVEYHHL